MNPPNASRENDGSNPRARESVRDVHSFNQSQLYPWPNNYNPMGQQQILHTHQDPRFQQYNLQNTYQYGTSYQMHPQQMTLSSWSGMPQNPNYIPQPGALANNVYLNSSIDQSSTNLQGHHNSFQPVYEPQHDGSNPLEAVVANISPTEQNKKSTTSNATGEESNINSTNRNKRKRRKRNKGNKAAQKKRAKARRRQQEQVTNINNDDMEISDIEDELDTKVSLEKPNNEAVEASSEPTDKTVHSDSGDPQELPPPESAPSITIDNTSNENSQKRERLQLELSKIKLENAKAKLIAAQRQKEGALRSKLLKKLSSVNDTSISAETYDLSEIDICPENDPAKQCPDISALRMPNLIISNIGEAGPEENIRPRSVDSLTVPVIQDDLQSKQDKEQLPISKAEKLRLNLELAKQRLKLEELRHQKMKKSTSLTDKNKVRKCVKNENDEFVPVKLSVEEMRRKHAELTEKVNSSRQANLQRLAEKEVSDLRKLVDKQQQILRYHVEQIKSSTTALSEDRQQLIIENAGIDDSKKSLDSLQLRRVSTLDSIQSVTKKLMKLRRQRELLK